MASHSLAGHTVLVTGAGKRLGRASALALANAGAGVIAHYNQSGADAASLRDEIVGRGGRAWLIQADLSDPTAAEGLVPRAVSEAGVIHDLVNCASIFPSDMLHEMTESSLMENLRVNAWAPFLLCKGLAGQGISSGIVNFLDTRIHAYDAQHVSYHLSKRMLFTMTRMMALEFAPDVRVNAVAPGLVLPPPGKDHTHLESLRHTNPLCAIGTAEEIGRAVVFLLASRFITGQVVYVDGGRHMLGGAYA
jgi:hypothetical protein